MGCIIRRHALKAKFPMFGILTPFIQTLENIDPASKLTEATTKASLIISCKFSFPNKNQLIYSSPNKNGVECYGISILLENETAAIRVKLRGTVFL